MDELALYNAIQSLVDLEDDERSQAIDALAQHDGDRARLHRVFAANHSDIAHRTTPPVTGPITGPITGPMTAQLSAPLFGSLSG